MQTATKWKHLLRKVSCPKSELPSATMGQICEHMVNGTLARAAKNVLVGLPRKFTRSNKISTRAARAMSSLVASIGRLGHRGSESIPERLASPRNVSIPYEVYLLISDNGRIILHWNIRLCGDSDSRMRWIGRLSFKNTRGGDWFTIWSRTEAAYSHGKALNKFIRWSIFAVFIRTGQR